MREYIFSLEIPVRDYELDSEGIVNNANYLHYLEHTRHAFIKNHPGVRVFPVTMDNRDSLPEKIAKALLQPSLTDH